MDALCRARGTTVVLVAIWTAVPFAAAFGGEIVTEQGVPGEQGGLRSRVPVVVPVAAMATLATVAVAWLADRAERAAAAPAAGTPPVEPADDALGDAPAATI